MIRFHKRRIKYAIRDFPPGFGTHCTELNLPQRSVKKPRTSEVLVKNPSTDHVVADPEPHRTCLKRESEFDHVLAAPRPKVNCIKQEPEFDHVLAAPIAEGSCLKREPEIRTCIKREPEFKNYRHDHVVAAPKAKGGCLLKQEAVSRNSNRNATPREKVAEVLRVYKEVFRNLERDKQARQLVGDSFDVTRRIDLKTQAVLEEMGKQVNTEKRIGSVPGIEVGDVFQYKTELRVVGLHFKTMCGIDYMKFGDVKLATSIVSSEGYGYNDKFGSGVVVYTGEGGNVISKEKKTEDQRLVKGNLALANSMRKKSFVRVIRGEERLDKKGKRYVYGGLYLVDKYWLEKDVRGKNVYKFQLCRISGQPPLT